MWYVPPIVIQSFCLSHGQALLRRSSNAYLRAHLCGRFRCYAGPAQASFVNRVMFVFGIIFLFLPTRVTCRASARITSDLQFPIKCDCIPSEQKEKQSSKMQCCAPLTWNSIPTFQRSWIISNKNMWIPLFNTPSSGEVPQHRWYQVRRSAEMLE